MRSLLPLRLYLLQTERPVAPQHTASQRGSGRQNPHATYENGLSFCPPFRAKALCSRGADRR